MDISVGLLAYNDDMMLLEESEEKLKNSILWIKESSSESRVTMHKITEKTAYIYIH